MKIGYAHVSTHDQDLALQLDALEKIGCEKIYQEERTRSTKERPQLKKMLDQFRPDDVIVIWKLDRLARSLRDPVDLEMLPVWTSQVHGCSYQPYSIYGRGRDDRRWGLCAGS